FHVRRPAANGHARAHLESLVDIVQVDELEIVRIQGHCPALAEQEEVHPPAQVHMVGLLVAELQFLEELSVEKPYALDFRGHVMLPESDLLGFPPNERVHPDGGPAPAARK